MRFSLRTLLLVMAWIGLVSIALANPNGWSAAFVGNATIVGALVAALVAIYRSGPTRAAALGYFVFCIGAIVFQAGLWPFGTSGVFSNQGVILFLFEMIHPGQRGATGLSFWGSPQERIMYFSSIYCHASASIMGVVGAGIAQALHATAPKQ